MKQLLEFISFLAPLLLVSFLMVWGAVELAAWSSPPNSWWHWGLLMISFLFIFAGGFFALFLLAKLYWEIVEVIDKTNKSK